MRQWQSGNLCTERRGHQSELRESRRNVDEDVGQAASMSTTRRPPRTMSLSDETELIDSVSQSCSSLLTVATANNDKLKFPLFQ